MAFNIFANLDNVKKKRVVAKPLSPTMSALPIANNVLAAITGSPVVIGEGTVSAGGYTYDGVTGAVYPTLGGCTTCGPGNYDVPLPPSNVSLASAPGVVDINPTFNIGGSTLAVAAFAVWWFFLRGK